MEGFVFRYETLLRHRRHVEQLRQRELATIMRTQMIMQGQLRRMQQDLQGSKQELGSALVGKIDFDRVGQFTRFNAQSAMRGRDVVVRLAQLEPQIAEARSQLNDAVRQRRALEMLRDRQYEQWQREQARREEATLDDLTTTRHARTIAIGGDR